MSTENAPSSNTPNSTAEGPVSAVSEARGLLEEAKRRAKDLRTHEIASLALGLVSLGGFARVMYFAGREGHHAKMYEEIKDLEPGQKMSIKKPVSENVRAAVAASMSGFFLGAGVMMVSRGLARQFDVESDAPFPLIHVN